MKLGLKKGAARISRGARALLTRLAAWMAIVTAWRWSAPLARGALGAAGLVILAAIGRSALAGGEATSATTTTSTPTPTPTTTTTSTPTPTSNAASTPSPASTTATPITIEGSPPPPTRATPDKPVILNAATAEDLRRLPGIGPKRAQAILALRQRLGRFRQVEDLMKVKGVGRATLKKIRPVVRLDPQPVPLESDAGTS